MTCFVTITMPDLQSKDMCQWC